MYSLKLLLEAVMSYFLYIRLPALNAVYKAKQNETKT